MGDLAQRRAAQDAAAEAGAAEFEKVIGDAMRAAADAVEAFQGGELPADYQTQLEGVFLALWGKAARESGRLIIDEFKDLFPLESKQDEESLFDQIVREFIELYGAQRVGQVLETTREHIRQLVADGQARGLSLTDIAKGIREAVPEIARLRANVIARTEVHSSAAFASQRVAQTSRRPLLKEWVAVEDHRVRDFGEGDGIVDEFSHRAIHGQRVALDQPYIVPTRAGGQEQLMFPGDPSGSAGNVINCRCQEIYVRAE